MYVLRGCVLSLLSVILPLSVAAADAEWRVTTGLEAICIAEGWAGETESEARSNCACIAEVATPYATEEFARYLAEAVRQAVEGTTLTDARDNAYDGKLSFSGKYFRDEDAAGRAIVEACPDAARARQRANQ